MRASDMNELGTIPMWRGDYTREGAGRVSGALVRVLPLIETLRLQLYRVSEWLKVSILAGLSDEGT